MLLVCSHCRCFYAAPDQGVCVCGRTMHEVLNVRLDALEDAGYRQWARGPLTLDMVPEGGLPEVRGLHLVWEGERPSVSYIEFANGQRWWLSSPTGKATIYAQTCPEQT